MSRAEWLVFVAALGLVVWWTIQRIEGSLARELAERRAVTGPGEVRGSFVLVPAGPGGARGTIDASRAADEHVAGRASLVNPPYTFTGRVACLEVESSRAVIGVVGISTRSRAARQPRAGLVTVMDGRGGAKDSIAYDLRRGTASPDCSAPVSFANQSPASGDTLVVRASSP